jgi:hypothetical protein
LIHYHAVYTIFARTPYTCVKEKKLGEILRSKLLHDYEIAVGYGGGTMLCNSNYFSLEERICGEKKATIIHSIYMHVLQS